MASLPTLPETATLLPVATNGRESSLAARSFFYSVFKHRRLVIGIFLLVFLASALAAFIRPRTWRANTKVLVKLGETVQLAPAEAPSRSVNLPLNPDVINTEAEIVKSRQVLAEAVERVGIKPEDGMSMEELLDKMQRALTVAPAPSSNVLQISYLGRLPDRAAKMVNTITDVYIQQHNEVYRNKGVRSFYGEQLRILEAQMKDSQHRLRAYLRKTNVIDIEQEVHLLNQDLAEAEKALKSHRAKIAGTARKLTEVEAQLAETPTHVPYQESYKANPTLQTFKNTLAGLEVDRYQALQAYMPDDRHVKDKEAAIADVQRRIKEERERVLDSQTIQSNEVYRTLQENEMTIKASLIDLQAREGPMSGHVSDIKKRVRELRDERFMINNLKQDADEKTYAFDLYWRKQEEARITEAMKDQSIVNVAVVEKAMPPIEPENGLLLPLLLGIVGGAILGCGMAVAVEYVNRRLRFEEEVERYLELPVLAVIPDLQTALDVAHA